MHHFSYQDGVLHAENVNLTALADQVGTPFYVYSEATLRRHYNVFADAFAGLDPLIAYSVKANSNIAVLKVLASEGAGADVVSGGELHRALSAGVSARDIVFSGVGKSADEMRAALQAGIYQFNVESAPELAALNDVAQSMALRAPVALRINPDVAAGGHDKISTGRAEDKFGIAWSQARRLYAAARAMDNIEIVGVDLHIGSQITELAPFEAAFTKVRNLITDLRTDGCAIERLDLGGGLGVPYDEGAEPPKPDAYGAMIRKVTKDLDVRLIFEPGRMIAANAGVLVSRVVFVKEGEARRFAILDAAMNDLMRPALYDAHHHIKPVRQTAAPAQDYDVVGPVCESTDRFAKARAIAGVEPGALLAIMTAGAYGASLSSQYNSRPLIPEVLVCGSNWSIVRRRPDYREMTALESAPDWLG